MIMATFRIKTKENNSQRDNSTARIEFNKSLRRKKYKQEYSNKVNITVMENHVDMFQQIRNL